MTVSAEKKKYTFFTRGHFEITMQPPVMSNMAAPFTVMDFTENDTDEKMSSNRESAAIGSLAGSSLFNIKVETIHALHKKNINIIPDMQITPICLIMGYK